MPLAYICVKVILVGLVLGEVIFGGVCIGGNFAFQNGLGLTIKQLKTLKQPETANPNGPWA